MSIGFFLVLASASCSGVNPTPAGSFGVRQEKKLGRRDVAQLRISEGQDHEDHDLRQLRTSEEQDQEDRDIAQLRISVGHGQEDGRTAAHGSKGMNPQEEIAKHEATLKRATETAKLYRKFDLLMQKLVNMVDALDKQEASLPDLGKISKFILPELKTAAEEDFPLWAAKLHAPEKKAALEKKVEDWRARQPLLFDWLNHYHAKLQELQQPQEVLLTHQRAMVKEMIDELAESWKNAAKDGRDAAYKMKIVPPLIEGLRKQLAASK